MTPEARPRRPYRWAVAAALVLVAGVAIAWVAVRALRHRAGTDRPAVPAEAIDTDRYLGPIETEADPGSGEQVAPFSGFAVSVETEPEGALVTVAGEERGESPVLAGVECEPGAKVAIRVAKAGLRPARATTVCRKDTLVKLTVRLAP